jgi:hypothetical protein
MDAGLTRRQEEQPHAIIAGPKPFGPFTARRSVAMKHYHCSIVLVAMAAGWALFMYSLPLAAHF